VLTAAAGLYHRLSVRENLEYFARLYGLDNRTVARRVDYVVDLLEMGAYANRRAGQLSSGMVQRAAIARAIVHDPPVLIFDEPTASLDVAGAHVVLEFIERSRAAGHCVILSTHIMHEAEKLCDHVGIIVGGRIVTRGTVAQIIASAGGSDLEEALLRLMEGTARLPAAVAAG
jgi:sodium transport system ATP-binding protein